ncbi:NAD-dependent epimerase/dehydratase family protein [Segetibacter aerophilus]|uniref:UDP-glucose 4-epimerase n=1 Tax=Segetibacter aerophilus TaxID=670293 RepID=A0A512BDG6_9BACT|nr:NAD-dependent epimerase/dehydratase family protein [Segetibacter aerophilus]GEO09907.1 UDP-glucose 4-epimerase [Segetibacter aerophilus]
MNIAIIGAAGFIGRSCVEYFISQGHEVTAADVIPVDELGDFYLLSSANTSFIELFQHRVFDFCINASGAASVPLSVQYPQRDFELNSYNVLKMLDAIRQYNPRCIFINFSSAAVYGNPTGLPICEDAALQPLSPYGHHKLIAEQICKEYRDFFGVTSHSLRVFSAYGPGLKKQFFWDLQNKIKEGGFVELFGTGKESRDFIFIEDILEAVDIVIKHSSQLPNAINIASGIEKTIEEATSIFIKCSGFKGDVRFGGQQREGDPINWRADISILKQFGFEPKYQLEVGLKKYIQWLIGEKG